MGCRDVTTARVLVVGAGVIGQIYGGRLAMAGHDVTMLARGDTATGLSENGIRLSHEGIREEVSVDVVAAVPEGRFGAVLVAVRADQITSVLNTVVGIPTDRLIFLQNVGTHLKEVSQLADGRAVFAFPGVGGGREQDGTIRYVVVPQQKTTVGNASGREVEVVDLLRSTGLPVTVTDDMPAWLLTHIVFLVGVGAALLTRDVDGAVLAADAAQVREMVLAIREGFGAPSRQGTTPTPAALRTIFTRVPVKFATWYWRRQLSGPVGAAAIAPHVAAARDNEMVTLAEEVRRLLGVGAPTPFFYSILQESRL